MSSLVRGVVALVSAVVLLAGLAGCSAEPKAPPAPLELTVKITPSGVEPSGKQFDVAKGQLVKLTATSEQDDELHVHGYDIAEQIGPDKPVNVEFTADKVGRFEVESHHPARIIALLNVR